MAWTAPRTWVTGEIVTASIMNTHVRDNLTAGFPTGSMQYVVANAGTDVTETLWQGGWLHCNGAQVSRTTYSALFNYLNALTPALPFGSGNGSTTFHLPNLTARVAVAHAPSGGHADVTTLGNTEGSSLANRRPKHPHSHSLTLPDHVHSHSVQAYHVEDGGSGSGRNYYGPVSEGASPNITTLAGSIGNPTTNPTLSGAIGAAGVSDDAPAYIVAGVWVIKT